jgi:hypothetical protein
MARPRKGEEKHRTHSVRFRVPESVRIGLDAVATARGLPLADIAVEAFEQYLDRQTRKNRPSPKARAA